MSATRDPELRRSPLDSIHRGLGAKMTAFAGYDLPLHYPGGIVAEHLHTRRAAALFDVSHMGQFALRGPARAAALESLVPADVAGLKPGAMRYTVLTDEGGGIVDDLIAANVGPYLFLVVNAARKAETAAHIAAALPAGCRIEELADRAMVALQGPAAAAILSGIAPGADALAFMAAAPFVVDGARLAVMRSGYTGEDGFELSIPGEDAERVVRALLGAPGAAPAGLGARDSLRLEAGFCLSGQDIGPDTTPVEAGLGWTIPRRRRAEGGFPGAGVVRAQLESGPPRRRVGIAPQERAPARAGAELRAPGGAPIGAVTSGGFGPSVGAPVAMGYVRAGAARPGAPVEAVVRGRPRPALIARLPFVAHRHTGRRGDREDG